MKTGLLLFVSMLTGAFAFAQQQLAASSALYQPVAHHRVVQTLSSGATNPHLDTADIESLSTRAINLFEQNQYEETIHICRLALEKHSSGNQLAGIYATYGQALFAQKRPEQAIEVYNEGIGKFAGQSQLHYHKAMALLALNKQTEALTHLQTSVTLNPAEARGHQAIATLQQTRQKDIPALLAYCRYLALEPDETGALAALQSLNSIFKGNATYTHNSVSINVSALSQGDSSENGEEWYDNFFETQYAMLANTARLEFDNKEEPMPEAELFLAKLETVCAFLKETQPGNQGFYWQYYAPYLIALYNKNLLPTFVYMAHARAGHLPSVQWVRTHPAKVKAFRKWNKEYKWGS